MTLDVQPISYAEACEYVRQNHRHHKPPQGHKFSIALNDGEQVVGVVMVGRPVARSFDDGLTLEVTRCCTDGTPNAASKLYGAARRATFALGYKRLVTYLLQSESGTTMRAAGWKCLGEAGGGRWSRDSRKRVDLHPTERKSLWEAVST